MNEVEHLLTCLSEECAEVSQRVSKALRFGLQEIQPGQPYTNAQRIVQELGDLLAVAEMLADANIIEEPGESPETKNFIAEKKAKVQKYMELARSEGALTA